MEQIIIGVSGGSGSGKSCFCKQFVKLYKKNEVILICADRYFKNKLPKMISPLTQREYDDWNSLESVDYDALGGFKEGYEDECKNNYCRRCKYFFH